VRFALVGFSNSAVDLGITNLLALLTAARSEVALLLISIVACSTATLNSYLLNRRWTFRDADGKPVPGSVPRFAAVAALSMVVNSSVFLFLAKYLPTQFGLPELVAINIAKIGGIAVAMVVSFAGYRFGVFRTDEIKEFRRRFRFSTADEPSLALQLGTLLAAAAAVRLGYLFLTTAVFGDAVNYSRVAGLLASGNFAEVDAFWSNLFCFWQAPFHILGLGSTAATLSASLVPGILLVSPVVWMARSLFGPRVAWLAGALTVVHPRLVEYSCNGYAESFYLLAFTCGTAFLVAVLRGGGVAAGLGWGLSFGVYAAVRPEAVAAFVFSALLALALTLWGSRDRRSDRGDGRPVAPRRVVAATAAGLLGFGVVVSGYAGLSKATLGESAVLQKAGNLGKQFSEQLDWEQAARETYGADGRLLGPPDAPRSLAETAEVLVRRFPRNLFYSMERMPGVLLSPVILFALLLPVFVRRARKDLGEDAVVGWMALFPILLYPLIQVEPRLFFSILVPAHIFGAAGLVAVTRYLGRRSGADTFYSFTASWPGGLTSTSPTTHSS
jgi:putative flippase GtrA